MKLHPPPSLLLGPALAAAALSACSSGTPTVLLQLVPVAPNQPAMARPGAPVALAAVEIPGSLDRSELVAGSGGTALHTVTGVQWSGPLSEMVRTVMAQDLARRLAQTTVLLPGDPAPPGGVRVVHVAIQSFLPETAGAVTLEADWWMTAPGSQNPTRRGRFNRVVPGNPGPTAEARTMSAALGELADAIASQAR